MNIKERIRLIIDHICNADIGEYEILASLRAILRDLDAEPPKPTSPEHGQGVDVKPADIPKPTPEQIDKMRKDVGRLCSDIWSNGFDAEGPDDKDFCHEIAGIDVILEGLYDIPTPAQPTLMICKPTPEQLKVLCVELDGSTPRGCKDGDYVWCNVGGIIVSAIYHELIGKLRWHLKDAPTPEKAKHCTRQPEEMEEDPTTTFDSTCGTEPPNPIRETFIKGLGTVRACIDCGVLVSGGPTRCNYCVSLMTTMAPALSKTSGEDSEGSPDRKEGGAGCHAPEQPALMSTCEGCHKEFGDGDCFEGCTGYTDIAAFRTMPRHNYAAKEPEPEAPSIKAAMKSVTYSIR